MKLFKGGESAEAGGVELVEDWVLIGRLIKAEARLSRAQRFAMTLAARSAKLNEFDSFSDPQVTQRRDHSNTPTQPRSISRSVSTGIVSNTATAAEDTSISTSCVSANISLNFALCLQLLHHYGGYSPPLLDIRRAPTF